jgi:hypothetical protein
MTIAGTGFGNPGGKFRSHVDERIATLGKGRKDAIHSAKALGEFKSKQAEAAYFRDHAAFAASSAHARSQMIGASSRITSSRPCSRADRCR